MNPICGRPRRGAGPAKAGTPNPIRVLIVDDHPLVRRGIINCLARYRRIAVVGEAADGHQALLKTAALSPDVVVMDISMPNLDGLATTRLLLQHHPALKILILSVHDSPQYLPAILKCGACGFLAKNAPIEQLAQAIKTIVAGQKFFNPAFAQATINQYTAGFIKAQPPDSLTPREREVLIAIADGLGAKQIASRLGIGVRTIESHRQNLMQKLNIRSTAGLTRFAVARGWVTDNFKF